MQPKMHHLGSIEISGALAHKLIDAPGIWINNVRTIDEHGLLPETSLPKPLLGKKATGIASA